MLGLLIDHCWLTFLRGIDCSQYIQAMSSESTARNRATLEEATNSAHFESTFFMSPLGGDSYGKTSLDIPSTVAPGKTAPALGSLEPAPRCI